MFDAARCCARPTFHAVCRQLLAVADSLLSLAAAASRVLSGGSVPTWLPMQVEAGCLALGSCAMLARAAEQLPAAVQQAALQTMCASLIKMERDESDAGFLELRAIQLSGPSFTKTPSHVG